MGLKWDHDQDAMSPRCCNCCRELKTGLQELLEVMANLMEATETLTRETEKMRKELKNPVIVGCPAVVSTVNA